MRFAELLNDLTRLITDEAKNSEGDRECPRRFLLFVNQRGERKLRER